MTKTPQPEGEPDDGNRPGYKNPPKKHQFKKGTSGNPSGRPRKATSVTDSIGEVLSENVTLSVGGDKMHVEAPLAFARSQVTMALRGDLGAIETVLVQDAESQVLGAIVEQANRGGYLVAPERIEDIDEWQRIYGEPLRRQALENFDWAEWQRQRREREKKE